MADFYSLYVPDFPLVLEVLVLHYYQVVPVIQEHPCSPLHRGYQVVRLGLVTPELLEDPNKHNRA